MMPHIAGRSSTCLHLNNTPRPLAITRVNHQIRTEFLTLHLVPSLDDSFESTGAPRPSIESLNSHDISFLIDLSATCSNALIKASYQHGRAVIPNLYMVFSFRTAMTAEAHRATAISIGAFLKLCFTTSASITVVNFVTTIDLLSIWFNRPFVRASSCTLPVLIRKLEFTVLASVGGGAPKIEWR